MLFNYKFRLFSISLSAIWLMLFIKNVNIPLYFGRNPQFVGWDKILTFGNIVAFISLFMMVVAFSSIIRLRHRLKGSPDGLTITLTEVKDKNYAYINTLATIVTLFSVIFVPVETWREFIVFIVMMFVIIISFLKTNLYYCNPIFAALGYRLYMVSSNSTKLPVDSVAIYYGKLSVNAKVVPYHVSDNVYFLK